MVPFLQCHKKVFLEIPLHYVVLVEGYWTSTRVLYIVSLRCFLPSLFFSLLFLSPFPSPFLIITSTNTDHKPTGMDASCSSNPCSTSKNLLHYVTLPFSSALFSRASVCQRFLLLAFIQGQTGWPFLVVRDMSRFEEQAGTCNARMDGCERHLAVQVPDRVLGQMSMKVITCDRSISTMTASQRIIRDDGVIFGPGKVKDHVRQLDKASATSTAIIPPKGFRVRFLSAKYHRMSRCRMIVPTCTHMAWLNPSDELLIYRADTTGFHVARKFTKCLKSLLVGSQRFCLQSFCCSCLDNMIFKEMSAKTLKSGSD